MNLSVAASHGPTSVNESMTAEDVEALSFYLGEYMQRVGWVGNVSLTITD